MSEEPVPVGVGVVGLGVMGAQHIESYRVAAVNGAHNRLVAVCDADAQRRAGLRHVEGNLTVDEGAEGRLFDPAVVKGYADPAALFADPAVELVSLCTYTDSHVPLAKAALEAGKHVLVEKPVALTAAAVRVLGEVAAAHPRQLCMPAMCMRFWPGWRWLAAVVRDGSMGAVRRASFRRVSAVPHWGSRFYEDATRSGGALVDLHVHDADFVRWCFGPPIAVVTTGSLQNLRTQYIYEDERLEVVAEGGWDKDPRTRFFMGYRVEFDKGTADFMFGREPELRVEHPGRSVEPVALMDGNGYDAEVAHLVHAVLALRAGGEPSVLALVDEAVGLMAMLEAERRSLESGERVTLEA
jgi:predicted dehydrogenase